MKIHLLKPAFVLLFFCLLCSNWLSAQDKNRKQQQKITADEAAQVEQIVQELKKMNPADEAYADRLERLEKLSKKLDTDSVYGKTHMALGRYYQRNGEMQMAWREYQEAKYSFLKVRLIDYAAGALYNQCIVLLSQGLGDSLIGFLDKNRDFINMAKDRQIRLYLKNAYPIALQTSGRNEEALHEFEKLVPLAEEIKDTTFILSLYINIGVAQSSFDSAMTWLRKGLKLSEKDPDKHAELLLKIGARYTFRDDVLKDSALFYFLEAEKNIDNFFSPILKIQTENFICDFFMSQGEYDVALPYLRKARAYARNLTGKNANIILHNMAICFMKLNQADSARIYLEQYKQKIDKAGDGYEFMLYHHAMAKFVALKGDSCSYEAQQQRNKALSYAKQINETRVSTSLIVDAMECALGGSADKKMVPLFTELLQYCAYFHPLLETGNKLYNYSGFLANYARLESLYGNKQKALDLYHELTQVMAKIEQEKYEMGHNEALVKYKSDLKDAEITYNKRKNAALTIGAALLIMIILGIVFALYKASELNKKINTQKNELEQINHVKDRLFSVIGHDLRAPVSSLLSLVQIIEKGNLTAEKLEAMSAELKNKLGYTAGLMDNLLNWAHSQMEGYKPVMSNFDLGITTRDAIGLLRSEADRKNIIIQNHIQPGTEIYADVNMTSLLMRNLLSNAIKFTAPGGKVLVDFLESGTARGFRIQDFGVGLGSDVVKEFNDPASVKPIKSTWGTYNEKGTGIGLMLCKTFTTLMGGTIKVSSEPGSGTRVTVLFG